MANTPISWQYVSGFFDGEGSIYIAQSNYSHPNYYKGTEKGYVRLNMSITNKEVLETIKEFVGAGYITSPIRKDWKPQWKVVHQLTIYSRGDIKRILIAMLPYLIVKKAKAEQIVNERFQ
jgi:hypothetical protein